jgi:hypothetical protein
MTVKARVLFAIATLVFVAALGSAIPRAQSPQNPPSNAEVAFATEVSDLLLNELLAALFQEFNETTPANVEHGKQAISLIFNDLNRDIRLIGTFDPLGGEHSSPDGTFERRALERALQGQADSAVQRVNGRWYFRRTIALSNAFHASCVLCHANFTPEFFAANNNPGQWVGALALRVPIVERD